MDVFQRSPVYTGGDEQSLTQPAIFIQGLATEGRTDLIGSR